MCYPTQIDSRSRCLQLCDFSLEWRGQFNNLHTIFLSIFSGCSEINWMLTHLSKTSVKCLEPLRYLQWIIFRHTCPSTEIPNLRHCKQPIRYNGNSTSKTGFQNHVKKLHIYISAKWCIRLFPSRSFALIPHWLVTLPSDRKRRPTGKTAPKPLPMPMPWWYLKPMLHKMVLNDYLHCNGCLTNQISCDFICINCESWLKIIVCNISLTNVWIENDKLSLQNHNVLFKFLSGLNFYLRKLIHIWNVLINFALKFILKCFGIKEPRRLPRIHC